MKILFVWLRALQGQKQVGSSLPMLCGMVFGCSFRKDPGLAFLACCSHITLVLAPGYCERCPVIIDLYSLFLQSFHRYFCIGQALS